jgi:hypothetical protein
MYSDGGKTSGGSGGGPAKVDHADVRFVDTSFERCAPEIMLMSAPTGTVDKSSISLIAADEGGEIVAQAKQSVIVIGGAMGTYWPANLNDPGVKVITVDPEMTIHLGRKLQEDGSGQNIVLDPDGNIYIDAGIGDIMLKSGESYIEITPDGITIKGTLVNIN